MKEVVAAIVEGVRFLCLRQSVAGETQHVVHKISENRKICLGMIGSPLPWRSYSPPLCPLFEINVLDSAILMESKQN